MLFSKLTPETKNTLIAHLTDSMGDLNSLENAIRLESCEEVLDYIKEHLDLKKYNRNIVFTVNTKSYIGDRDINKIQAIIDFKRVNNVQQVNGLLRAVNEFLPDGGIYIGRLETYRERKLKMYRKYGRQIGRIFMDE